jgi:hypothetical protein
VDNEVMIISDNTDSEPELKMTVRTKSFDLSMEISDPETMNLKFYYQLPPLKRTPLCFYQMNGNENKNSQSIQMLICHHS